MPHVDEQVVDFYYELFDRIFSARFRPKIQERLKRDAVQRQVQEAAGAASQTLTRFFLSQQLSETQVAHVLGGLAALKDLVGPEDVANPNRTPEALAEDLSGKLPCPLAVSRAGSDAVYRLALYSVVQGLMQVGPIMAEWQRLSFSSTFEMLRRIVQQLNQITEGLEAFSRSGQSAADERYELAYRDHLLQRFYRVEAGTVRMATNLNYDLRQLFVMPRVTVRPRRKLGEGGEELDAEALMNLSAARAIFGEHADFGETTKTEAAPGEEKNDKNVAAVEQVRRSTRNVIVGVPGGGKSTLLEWLQLSIGDAVEELICGGGQAIPLLLRVRQLNPKDLPHGAALVEKTAGRSMASLMPAGWVERQMKAGRVLFMLDGLDETEPTLRDKYVLPWLAELCKDYPGCLYLVSSRPVGYPTGALRKLKFAECDLQDFGKEEVTEYARHWCIARRLAQNEPEEEAREEGEKEGDQIVEGFKGNAYIRNLARNPLMLSAICLVNYFEGGQLPKDRALLYKLCVEGLLHHWDARRGIRSEFTLDEKLRVCREVAIQMQADDRAEYEAAKVLKIFTEVLGDKARAKQLLEHIRYRTGLLIERRPKVFAFAHLTFQEYLAARAVYEGNRRGIEAEQLAREHDDGRWGEVIALYCGFASTKAARSMIKTLIRRADTVNLAQVLTESYISAGADLQADVKLRREVLKRIAIAPTSGNQLGRFKPEEAESIANSCIGKIQSNLGVSEAHRWLFYHPQKVDVPNLLDRLEKWPTLNLVELGEVFHLMHYSTPDQVLLKISSKADLYALPGPKFSYNTDYTSQAIVALQGLQGRLRDNQKSTVLHKGETNSLLQILRVLAKSETLSSLSLYLLNDIAGRHKGKLYPQDPAMLPELRKLILQVKRNIAKHKGTSNENNMAVASLQNWAQQLEVRIVSKTGKKNIKRSSDKSQSEGKIATSTKMSIKRPTKRRRSK